MSCDPSCYVCGHAPEEHLGENSGCDEPGCDCVYFEERECDEEDN